MLDTFSGVTHQSSHFKFAVVVSQ